MKKSSLIHRTQLTRSEWPTKVDSVLKKPQSPPKLKEIIQVLRFTSHSKICPQNEGEVNAKWLTANFF